jgi:hypothetical protein
MKQKQGCGGDLGCYRNPWYNGIRVSVEGAKRERGGKYSTESGVGKKVYTWRLEGRGMKIEVRGRCNEDRRVRMKQEGRGG